MSKLDGQVHAEDDAEPSKLARSDRSYSMHELKRPIRTRQRPRFKQILTVCKVARAITANNPNDVVRRVKEHHPIHSSRNQHMARALLGQ